MEDKIVRVPVELLKEASLELLINHGLSVNDANIVVTSFIEADLCGVSTHGVTVLPAHLNRLESGGYNTNPKISVVRSGPSFSVLDGDNAIGPVSATYSMNLAIDEAVEKGAYFVFSRNNNTFGPAFIYTSLAAKKGLIGIAVSNTPAAMAPLGGKEKLLGTNPISIAVPVNGEPPILLDMSTSAVAKSKINLAKIEGREIPIGWATDSEGIPTTDPEKAIAGLVLPMAEHKGYGLALMLDILAGVLSGAAFLNNVGSFYRNTDSSMNVGFMFIALNPEKIFGSEFFGLIKGYVNKIKSCTPVDDETAVRFPGENKALKREENLKKGIALHYSTIEKINGCLRDKNINIVLSS